MPSNFPDLSAIGADAAADAGLSGRLVLPTRASPRRPVPAAALVWADPSLVDAPDVQGDADDLRATPPAVMAIRAALIEHGVAVLAVHPAADAGPAALGPAAIDAVVDALGNHASVDAESVALIGVSGAGVLAARGTSAETARWCVLIDPREPAPAWWAQSPAEAEDPIAAAPELVAAETTEDVAALADPDGSADTPPPALDGVGIAATPIDMRRPLTPGGPEAAPPAGAGSLLVTSVIDIDLASDARDPDGEPSSDAASSADAPLRPSHRLAARPASRPAIVLAPATSRCAGALTAARLDAAVELAGGRVRVERLARSSRGFTGAGDLERVVERTVSIVAADRRRGTPLGEEVHA
ncbi:MAG: hypothetical protein AB8G96_09870 [Phycisphaerales bacterium]